MKMKVLISGLFILAMGAINAQPGPKRQDMNPSERAEMALSRIEKNITLSEQERKSMVEIYTEFFTEHLKYMEEMREKMNELRNEKDAKVEKLLGNDRFIKYKEHMEQKREHMGDPPKGGMHQHGGSRNEGCIKTPQE